MAQPSPPVDLSHHFASTTKRREASGIKELYKYFFIPGIANLAGGLPNAAYFPYDTLEARVATPQRFQPSNIDPTKQSGNDTKSSRRLIIPRESHTTNLQEKIDITTALQYGTAEGLPPLASFVRQFVRHHLHPNVPYAGGPETLLTSGATDGFSKTIEAFTNIWNPERDWTSQREGILCEEFVYMNAPATAKPRGLNIVPVTIDTQGMLARGKGGLADVLENWDFRKGRRPHLMYTITIGQNPTGGTLSVERRKEIYALCHRYDIIIVEDDPYWNLQYPSAAVLESQHRGTPIDRTFVKRNYNAHGKSSGYEFLDSLVPSYLSVDTDGRVVRLDTFSKTIAPGCRLGWITAQPAVIERLTRITETATQAPSGFVQAMVANLILGQQTDDSSANSGKSYRSWQMDGWIRWLEGLRGGYERRMQDMCSTLEEGKYVVAMDSGLENPESNDESSWEVVDKLPMYDFSWPTGGMFVWIKLRLDTHPLHGKYELARLSKALWVHLTQKPYLCLLGPGQVFAPSQDALDRSWQYYRLCFAAMPESEVKGITVRLVDGFRSFWQRTDLDGLEEEEAINAIYEPDTVTINGTTSSSTANSTLDLGTSSSTDPLVATVKLRIPEHPHLSFMLGFDASYPDTPPKVLGTASTASRGEGKVAVDVLEDILGRTYQPGAVCLFDVINEAVEAFQELNIGGSNTNDNSKEQVEEVNAPDCKAEEFASLSLKESFGLDSPPNWILSDVVTEKKSVFVGRAAHVTSLEQAQAYLDYLLATEKKVAAATHNISAWRIRQQKPSSGKGESTEMIVQDCDDDGETAAGGRLLHLMQLMDVWDVVVVVTRWYGGVLLGPDRFRIINAVGRDALVKGGFVKESTPGGNEKGKKKGKK
ncbi:putative aromatic amino acid aminotransferase [Aspergillus alliaceus]|uniref:putative aromatic amino acid aminotransferase n=1 Tax=Petromyces alliaceus TaxID=209559 RepID=UPI0012A4981A|nr:pyridoxal phosphate-dependent transferase [Aspergillus alliaceus]KAB8234760.1 pyridoxal phosphate-dependent transferase [Aspergillus alliaceus]